MTIIRRAVSAMQVLFGSGNPYAPVVAATAEGSEVENPRGQYELLRALYYNDRAEEEPEGDQTTIGLRSPTKAVVDFYAATMWPGMLPEALPVEPGGDVTDGDALTAAIHRLWQWSNWSARKQVYARRDAMLGDSLIKVGTRPNASGTVERVYLQLIKPDNLTEFDVDERDYLTYLRLDVPSERRVSDEIEKYTHTEVWDKRSGTYRVWEHDHGLGVKVADLGQPTREATMESFGIDFIPFVHAKHIDMGNRRGDAAIIPALVKAHEASRMATRLHDLMFQYNKADLVLFSNLLDADGNTVRPPLIGEDQGDTIEIGGQTLWRLPSGWDMKPSIASLPFEAHRKVLVDHLEHLEASDLPELAYYKVADSRELSGKAIRYMLIPAIAKAEEARGNAEGALVRAQQMALTIGRHHELPGFERLGRYEDGQLDHAFRERSIIPLTEEEQAEVDRVRAETAVKRQQYGWTMEALLGADGVDEADIRAMLAQVDAARAAGGVLDATESAEAQRLLDAALARGD